MEMVYDSRNFREYGMDSINIRSPHIDCDKFEVFRLVHALQNLDNCLLGTLFRQLNDTTVLLVYPQKYAVVRIIQMHVINAKNGRSGKAVFSPAFSSSFFKKLLGG